MMRHTNITITAIPAAADTTIPTAMHTRKRTNTTTPRPFLMDM